MKEILLNSTELTVLNDLCNKIKKPNTSICARIESIDYDDTTRIIDAIFNNDDWNSIILELLTSCTPEQLSYLIHKYSYGGNRYGDKLLRAMYTDLIIVPNHEAIDLHDFITATDKPKILLDAHWTITFECFFNEEKINAAYHLGLIPNSLDVNDEGEYPSLIDYLDKLTYFSRAGWVID